MKFGEAIEAVKHGHLVYRKGWNGKGMFIFQRPADTLPVSMVIDKVKSLPQSFKDWAAKNTTETGEIKFSAYLCMKAADGSVVNGWLASQSDILSEDWEIVKL